MLTKISDITLALNTLVEKGYKINEDGTIAPPVTSLVTEARRANAAIARARKNEIAAGMRALREAAIDAVLAANPDATQAAIGNALDVAASTIHYDLKRMGRI